jgi:protein-tyrosine-phosphatase
VSAVEVLYEMGMIETIQLPETDMLAGLVEFGAMPSPEPEKPMRVLFVCTGNTCRSPMAAAALNALGAGRYAAESAGLFPHTGLPISRYAIDALEDAGIVSTPQNNYKAHTARSVTESLVCASDRVIGITESHMLLLSRSYPAYTSKIIAMKRDISDPYGGTREDYRKCLAKIIDCLRLMFPIDRET